MHLKSLTLRGFKSFASATTLRFEPGITCVVGPNGSGKSNVVDALAWVMGEQGAKSLRGGKMEDVIFAGTASRAPLGRAEVVLTIDNSDGALPIDYTEVTIARTMFRHGGSEYAVNGQTARLLDVQELLSDSGIGREMHVIVGQGQLDSILQATPEGRRGFIEEAAGVLKHRKRKEKALRKLEACDTNLNRLSDLLGEIRRQLKPLGRQAEVARRAAVIQAEARDSRARLLADELVQASLALESDLADERLTRDRRQELETALEAARTAEVQAEEAVRLSGPELSAAAEIWYGLTALRERLAGTMSLATERIRHGAAGPEAEPTGRDPDDLEREAGSVAVAHQNLSAEVAGLAVALQETTATRVDREQAARAAEDQLARMVRAAADRREGQARLSGQLNGARNRAEAAEAEIARLVVGQQDAAERAARAHRAFTALESQVAGLDAGELGLDVEHETSAQLLTDVEAELAELRTQEVTASQQRAALAARLEALQLGQQRKDAAGALVAEAERTPGVLGALAVLLEVQPSYEVAVATALGTVADAVAVADLDAALAAFARLKAEDLGRAGLLIGDAAEALPGPERELPDGVRLVSEVVVAPAVLAAAVGRALRGVVVVDDLPAAAALVRQSPELVAVTRGGDLLGTAYAAGGSAAQPSLIEVQAAVEETEQRLAATAHAAERVRFAQAELDGRHQDARRRVEVALARLHESDAAMAAVAEELGQLSATARSAQAEADRLSRSMSAAEQARQASLAHLAELEERARLAQPDGEQAEPDPAERDERVTEERTARTAEIEARLALRTAEERQRSMAGRAEALRRAAQSERSVRAAAEARRERLRREADTAAAVLAAGGELRTQLQRSLALATDARTAAEATRHGAETALQQARAQVRRLAAEFETLVDVAHRDEMARTQQRLRVENLTERAMAELGLTAVALTEEFGPDRSVPMLMRADGTAIDPEDEPVDPVPYVREDQQKRLRAAERALAVLGRVNPLALEEFDALQERHKFLAEQLEDLRRTRASLMDIIAEVDTRVEQVFAEAYADVEQAFGRVFSRLFPGGEGRLVLTEPGNWLTTGVEVEARPPGKKIKRLSLLSGGERSLVAVAFLVSLFLARPSPFYILDEVEAALDDTNLGRLLEIYAELRANSQLLVITHQKRTMEVADALYGVTMRGDGVSTVISSRLRDTSVA